MNRKHSIIYFLAAFSNGLTVPFISLICLSHGATLANLSLIISVFAMMETYWQQDLLILLSHEFQWIFGVVSCLGYAGAILGGRRGARIGEGKKKQFYWMLRVLLPVTIFLLGISTEWYLFVLLYFGIYYIIGVGDLLERNMLHGAVPNECRASMLSMYSLFIRGGGAFSAVVSSGIVTMVGVNAIWTIVPGFVIVVYLVLFLVKNELFDEEINNLEYSIKNE